MSVIRAIQREVQSKAISCEELIRSVLNTIQQKNNAINAFVESFQTVAIERAKIQDDLISKGAQVPLLQGFLLE